MDEVILRALKLIIREYSMSRLTYLPRSNTPHRAEVPDVLYLPMTILDDYQKNITEEHYRPFIWLQYSLNMRLTYCCG